MAERKSFLLRVDGTLWEELEAWAQDELRSVNGQIEYLLRNAVQKRRGRKPGFASGKKDEENDTRKKLSRKSL
jgi:hypothetical protein